VLFTLAQCKHEQAERLEGRLEKSRLTGRTPAPSDAESARDAWKEATARWEMFLTENPDTANTAAARTMYARALVGAGDSAKAVVVLEDLSGNLKPLEKAARLYQASLLKK
jgi:hypothetical protein